MLPDEVREAVRSLERELADPEDCAAWDTIKVHLLAREAEVERLRAAATEARRVIGRDRQSLFDCHRNPKTDTVIDAPGIAGLKEYDDARWMKLRTRLVPLGCRMSVDGEVADAWHDAMAAHALLQAMGEIEGTYADCSTAEDVRTLLHERAAEILAGWLGEE